MNSETPISTQSIPHSFLRFFIASATLFILLDTWKIEGLWMPALKALPILSLLIIAKIELGGTTQRFVIVALSFSALGDILLELQFAHHFIFGLGAFLIAQLVYAAGFLRYAERLNRRSLARVIPIALVTLALGRVILPASGGLAPAVLFYLLAIVAMAVAASIHRGDSALLFTGAVTFMLSDTLIAINKFIAPLPFADSAIMLTYYGAQLAILYGIRRAQA
ncbi:lysoplasmalogenase [Microbulbifer sp. OS29]|uniref:Lysoplasmalogenase n=1 Tax=Microbulbifer okhotskensis TaxID=2926617 RepID=A0A9X2EJB6_9GAMM|nr:lysoplasmalogenase [Microbulbifer okhotskensis]MCO1332741.1 lysoplasmalogenase [Microbulbifer okhotskensis]